MGDTLRVLIADDHPLFLFAIAHSVELPARSSSWSARPAPAARRSPPRSRPRPDLAVLDVEMPDLDGLDVLRAIDPRRASRTRVLFVSGSLDATKCYELIEAGAAGVLEKDAMPDQIGDALLRIPRARPCSRRPCRPP